MGALPAVLASAGASDGPAQILLALAFVLAAAKLTVGLSMMPRGEVGLIFAGIGAQLMLAGEPVTAARRKPPLSSGSS